MKDKIIEITSEYTPYNPSQTYEGNSRWVVADIKCLLENYLTLRTTKISEELLEDTRQIVGYTGFLIERNRWLVDNADSQEKKVQQLKELLSDRELIKYIYNNYIVSTNPDKLKMGKSWELSQKDRYIDALKSRNEKEASALTYAKLFFDNAIKKQHQRTNANKPNMQHPHFTLMDTLSEEAILQNGVFVLAWRLSIYGAFNAPLDAAVSIINTQFEEPKSKHSRVGDSFIERQAYFKHLLNGSQTNYSQADYQKLVDVHNALKPVYRVTDAPEHFLITSKVLAYFRPRTLEHFNVLRHKELKTFCY